MYTPQLRAGRWLQPDDTYAVVLNTTLAREVGLSVGDWITFDHGLERESTWQVVGLLFDPLNEDSAHVPLTTLQREIGSVNRANTLWGQTRHPDPATTATVAQTLRRLYEAHSMAVAPESIFGMPTISQISAEMLFRFNILVLLAIMAVVIAAVGCRSQRGAIAHVLERRREIGVMRAIKIVRPGGRPLYWRRFNFGSAKLAAGDPPEHSSGLLYDHAGLALVWIGTHLLLYAIWPFIGWLSSCFSHCRQLVSAHSATQLSVRESLAYQ
jgi:hypothetical protein